MPLNVAQTDFEDIKINIINHLKTNNDFLDYDFTGSALNILVDALAYATHYGVIYANLNINEMFLDTGIIRSSVVSKAKELGYIPKQYTSAQATINLSVDMSGQTIPANILVDQNITFSGSDIDGNNYIFNVSEDALLLNDGNDVFSGEVNITEGKKITETWIYNANQPKKIILGSDKVDTENIVVKVKPFLGSTEFINKINSSELTLVNDVTEVFFIQETPQEKIEIYFGDGQMGKALEHNNVVDITYSKSSGVSANKISNFSLLNDVDAIARSNFTTTTVSSAVGGADRESIASIKHIAPKLYQSQNRCVTKDDYIAIILRDNSNIKSLNVWGGETEVPPQYGRFFISLNTIDGSELSPTKKTEILNNLKKYNVLTIIPEIIEPNKIEIIINSEVTYNPNKTSLTPTGIITKVNDSITNLFNTKLYDFDDVFRFSELLAIIDDSDTSIISNTTSIKLKEKLVTRTGKISNVFTFANEIQPKTFISSEWVDELLRTRKIIDANGDGDLYQTINGVVVGDAIGTIEYVNGTVTILDFDYNISNETISFVATPVYYDIQSKFNTLILQGVVEITTAVGS